MRTEKKIISLMCLALTMLSCDRNEEDGSLIVAVDNKTSKSYVYSILVDGKMSGSIVVEPNFTSSPYVNCGDDWVAISKTTNVSVITNVSGGKHKIELQRHGDNVIAAESTATMDGCYKVVFNQN